jgi:hypothetical protein
MGQAGTLRCQTCSSSATKMAVNSSLLVRSYSLRQSLIVYPGDYIAIHWKMCKTFTVLYYSRLHVSFPTLPPPVMFAAPNMRWFHTRIISAKVGYFQLVIHHVVPKFVSCVSPPLTMTAGGPGVYKVEDCFILGIGTLRISTTEI